MKAKKLKNQSQSTHLTTKLSLGELENVNGGRRKPVLDIPICVGTYCYWP